MTDEEDLHAVDLDRIVDAEDLLLCRFSGGRANQDLRPEVAWFATLGFVPLEVHCEVLQLQTERGQIIDIGEPATGEGVVLGEGVREAAPFGEHHVALPAA